LSSCTCTGEAGGRRRVSASQAQMRSAEGQDRGAGESVRLLEGLPALRAGALLTEAPSGRAGARLHGHSAQLDVHLRRRLWGGRRARGGGRSPDCSRRRSAPPRRPRGRRPAAGRSCFCRSRRRALRLQELVSHRRFRPAWRAGQRFRQSRAGSAHAGRERCAQSTLLDETRRSARFGEDRASRLYARHEETLEPCAVTKAVTWPRTNNSFRPISSGFADIDDRIGSGRG